MSTVILTPRMLDMKRPVADRRLASMSEDQIQKGIIKELDFRRIDGVPMSSYIHHSPNGGERASKVGDNGKRYSPEGQKLKAMGTKAGFPDLFVFKPMSGFHGLFVELKKAKKGKYLELIINNEKPKGTEAQDSQVAMISNLNKQGYIAVVAYGHDPAVSIIKDYLMGKIGDWLIKQKQ